MLTLNGDLEKVIQYSLSPLSAFLPSPLPPTSEPPPTDTASHPGITAGPLSKPGLDNKVMGDERCRGGAKGLGRPIGKWKERLGRD